jgi:hypothetical protein
MCVVPPPQPKYGNNQTVYRNTVHRTLLFNARNLFVTMCRESGQSDFLGFSQSHDFETKAHHQIAILTILQL